MIQIDGRYGIYAKVLKHSIASELCHIPGQQIISLEVSYPRIILAELNTHCMIAKSSSSSRAIPFEKMKEQLTGRPVRFGQANPGMQDRGEDYQEGVVIPQHLWPVFNAYLEDQARQCGLASSPLDASCYIDPEDGEMKLSPTGAWNFCKFLTTDMSNAFYKTGYHKQVYNRLTEPFQMMKTVLTFTEGANFDWLRHHEAADPTLQELARCMVEVKKASVPQVLHPGEWHLPYVETHRGDGSMADLGGLQNGELIYFVQTDELGSTLRLTAEQARKVSAARSAAVSFRNVDYTLEKSEQVYERLIGDARKHASAFEHQASPIRNAYNGSEDDNETMVNHLWYSRSWEPGVSHMDREGKLWSGKFRGWIQHRKLIDGENVPGFSLEEAQC